MYEPVENPYPEGYVFKHNRSECCKRFWLSILGSVIIIDIACIAILFIVVNELSNKEKIIVSSIIVVGSIFTLICCFVMKMISQSKCNKW